MRLGQIFILAYEHDDRIPELECLGLVLFQALSNNLCLADIRLWVPCVGIGAKQKVDASTIQFFPGKKIIKFCSRRSKSFAGPVRDFPNAKALRISMRQK